MEIDKVGECFGVLNFKTQPPPPPPQPPQPKKQVRRRLHTSKPYQERLLNMAEARREIATALKFHRASMKQQEAASNDDLLSHPRLEEVPYHWPIATIVPPPPLLHHENLNLALPNQTLGLNLNFQDFSNLATKIYHNPSSASSSPPSSAAISVAAEEAAVPNFSGGVVMNGGRGAGEVDVLGGGLHQVMEDEEMDIRSLGEQHQMEWNDSVNLVTSARRCKFLNTTEIGPEGDGKAASHEDGEYHLFEQVMEFPPWLINPKESCCLQQLFDHHFCDEYTKDPALPCMDIGEIEGMDGEWLA